MFNELRKSMTNTFFKDIENMVNSLSDGDIERMKDMVKALNDMLVKQIAGEDPEFDKFMAEFGDMFGDDPPQNLDELLEQMRQQMAAAQSLMNSMSPEQRQALQDMFSGRFGDPELESELSKLAKELDFLTPDSQRYRFSGEQSLDLEAAMQIMREMHETDELLGQLQDAERQGDLSNIDKDLLRDILGDEEAEQLQELEKLMKMLEEAGYVRSNDEGAWELTPRGSRIIGQKALGEIYQRPNARVWAIMPYPKKVASAAGEDTKAYEFGDPFHLHMPRTLRNAINRNGPGAPAQLQPQDLRSIDQRQLRPLRPPCW